MSNKRGNHSATPWVEKIDLPVWVRGPDGIVNYMNDQAGTLLGRDPKECIGRLCHLVVAGFGEDGKPLCGPNCGIARMASLGDKVGATDMRVPGADMEGVHVRVVMIPVEVEDGYDLVHCAFEVENEHRALEYLQTVVHRSPLKKGVGKGKLTRRERQILGLLAKDHSLYTIAEELDVSHATVRNHVQHVLTKLRVHSIAEAIAWHLTSHD